MRAGSPPVRRVISSPDPIVLIVAGGVEVAAALGLFERLELTGDAVAQLGAGLVMMAAAVRMAVCQRRNLRHDRQRGGRTEGESSGSRRVERSISDRLANGIRAFGRKGKRKG